MRQLVGLLFLAFFTATAGAFPAQDSILSGTLTSTTSSTTIDLSGSAVKNVGVVAVVTNATGAAAVLASASDINAATDTFTKTAHGLVNGTKGQWTTSSALPTGLSTSTDYWVVNAAADTYQVSATYGGAAVNITNTGTGNQTFTPTALSGTLKLQVSNNGTSWVDEGAAQNVTATGVLKFDDIPCPYDYAKLVYTYTAGAVTIAANVRVKAYHEGTVP